MTHLGQTPDGVRGVHSAPPVSSIASAGASPSWSTGGAGPGSVRRYLYRLLSLPPASPEPSAARARSTTLVLAPCRWGAQEGVALVVGRSVAGVPAGSAPGPSSWSVGVASVCPACPGTRPVRRFQVVATVCAATLFASFLARSHLAKIPVPGGGSAVVVGRTYGLSLGLGVPEVCCSSAAIAVWSVMSRAVASANVPLGRSAPRSSRTTFLCLTLLRAGCSGYMVHVSRARIASMSEERAS